MAERLLPFMTKTHAGVYRYRRQAPQALRETLGCWEIRRSLGRDYFEAVQTYKAVHAEAEKALTGGAQVPTSDREVVIRLIQRAGISASHLASLINGTASDELKYHLSNILDAGALENEYREGERAGKEARVSLEAIRAINAGRVPDQVHTLETALKFYVESRKGDNETLNKTEENRAENLIPDYPVSFNEPHDATDPERLDAFRRVRDRLADLTCGQTN